MKKRFLGYTVTCVHRSVEILPHFSQASKCIHAFVATFAVKLMPGQLMNAKLLK